MQKRAARQRVTQLHENMVEAAGIVKAAVGQRQIRRAGVGQREREGRALTDSGFRHEHPAVALRDAAAKGQPDAETVRRRGVEAVRIQIALEDVGKALRLDAAARVGHGELNMALTAFDAHADRAALRREFQRVGEQVQKRALEHGGVECDDVALVVMLHSEVNLPIDFLVNQTLTLGTEWNQQRMKDLSSNTQALTGTNTGGAIDGVSATDRSPYSKAEIFSLFAENNMELTDSTIVTPGLRFDHHSIVGNNWSPALNISQGLGDDFTLKMGIARAYKAPSLYQTNPNYILYSKGQGCYASAGGCYLQGNDDLKAETSINKEIGLEFKRDGWLAGVTWFRNDYRNKIEAGYVAVGQNAVGTDLYQWDNVPKAVVEGLEGSLNVPVSETVMWTNNITYMLKSENKTTGDRLSIIPEYTLNSTLSWQAREDLSMQTTFTWYGKQQPKKYNYKGQPAVGPETKEISPYSIVGLSATWDVTKNVSLTGGVDNLFDKRLWRAGNAQTTGDLAGANYIAGAGAYTYNEPGRTWYMSVNTHF